jgi:hypothetical protein
VDKTNTHILGFPGISWRYFPTVKKNGTFIWLVNSAYNIHQGGFSRPIFSAKGVHLPFPYLKADFMQGPGTREYLGDIFYFQ